MKSVAFFALLASLTASLSAQDAVPVDGQEPANAGVSIWTNPGQPIEPKVEEFVRFILSQEGRQCVQREGRYIPMIAKVVNEQLKKSQ